MTDFIYDIETYPNVFTCAFEQADSNDVWIYEISDHVNEGMALMTMLNYLHYNNHRLVGFNNINFDYPIIHKLIEQQGNIDAFILYHKAKSIIESFNSIKHIIWDNNQYIPQIDLFKIHHFDNKSRSTSLKMIEFNLRSSNIQDLPYEPGTKLTPEQIVELKKYNLNDVAETKQFYKYTLPKIKFREQLIEKYNKNFINHNDTKIGKDIVINELESAGIRCFIEGTRKPIQTIRPSINLNDAVFDWIKFISPEFKRMKKWFQSQVITETNGIFKDLTCSVKGFEFKFGLGGIHGSIKNAIIKEDNEYEIIDVDVSGYYPELAIVNKLFPQHLTEKYCEIYEGISKQRKTYEKGTLENAALKLAVNGTYGDTNNAYSPFYDPLYTMTTTINGQLLLCVLAEHLLQIPGITLIQVNTDGLTVKIRKDKKPLMEFITKWWCKITKLNLEYKNYSAMYIRDVNNYFAASDGKVCKRKGVYRYKFNPYDINISIGDLDWTSDHSALVIPKVAEAVLIGNPLTVEELLRDNKNLYDFCLRTKVPRSSKLVLNDGFGNDKLLQNICRYYVSNGGGYLVKLMPPTPTQAHEGKTDLRRIGINVGWQVTPCNNIKDATEKIDYNYYHQEINKLVENLKVI